VDTGNIIFNTINPKAQEIAKKLRTKSDNLKNKQQSNALLFENESSLETNNTESSKQRLNQVASVALSAFAFGFENWLWHLAIAGVLMIIRTLYRRRIN